MNRKMLVRTNAVKQHPCPNQWIPFWWKEDCGSIWNPFEKSEVPKLWEEKLDKNEAKWGVRNPYGPDLVLTWSWIKELMTWRETDCLLMGVINCLHQDCTKIWLLWISWDGRWMLTKLVNALMVTQAIHDACDPTQGSENSFEWRIGNQDWVCWWNCEPAS